MKKSIIIILLVLFIDQAVKFWIKTHFYYGEEHNVIGSWFRIHFIENSGMAFGMQLGGNYGKLLLSLFRVVAIGGIAWYLWTLIKANAKPGLIAGISLVFAGAFGNMIDSAFYGIWFDETNPFLGNIALFMPHDGGYSTLMHGKVVDMLYFPLFDGTFPSWFPIWGGEHFSFFDPVFNIADSSITIGVVILLLFQKRYFGKTTQAETEVASQTAAE